MNKNFFKISLVILFIQVSLFSYGQDIFTRGLVYQVPAMKKVITREKIEYLNINDTSLTFDIYYPPAFDFKKKLPLVIFNNGVGSMDIPRWGIYKDWARLSAANGMIAVNYQARSGNALSDGESFIDHLIKNAAKLSVDPGKIGMWTCSANARTGMRLSFKSRPAVIKSLVVYYGGPDSLGQLRQDLPTLIVRPGLDAQFVNARIENFLQNALQQDAQFELINYVKGIHAFDAYQKTDEAKEIIVKTITFLKKNLTNPYSAHEFVLTNKNFMWLIMNNQLPAALSEFRKARAMYRADSSFQPFFNAVIREDVLNANGYFLLQNGKQGEALEVFKLAVETYPESPNAYESLSEALEARGNKEEAIRNAELCLQKLPSANGMDENFRQVVKRSAEERIRRLKTGANVTTVVIPPRRAHHELVYDEKSETVLLTAGSTPLDSNGSSYEMYNDIWRFNGREWKQSGIAGDRRSGIRMAYDSKRNKLFSFGGWFNGLSFGDLRVMENSEWKILSNLPEMKASEPGFVYDSDRDRLITFGGSVGRGSVNNTTWEWDGSSWKKFTGLCPAGRQAFVMVYDSKRKKTVLFGGADGSGKRFSDVWEFDGTKWDSISVTGDNPGPRISPGSAYDSKRGLIIIFGGISANGMQSDTWSWNGKEWKQLATTGPSKRVMGYIVYDKKRDRVVLFGGRKGWPNDANDTWEWDGATWKEIK